MAEKKRTESLTKQQMVEMLNREEKLVNNKKILATLPDKGKKIINLVERLKQEISLRDQIDAAASRLEGINISNNSRKNRVPKCSELDSDDDDVDHDTDKMNEELLEFCGSLAESSVPNKKVEKEKDFIETKQKEMHTKLIEKQFDGSRNKTSSMWNYESAVTPQPYKYQKAKMINLQESFTLQQMQQKNLEQLQAEHAARRLRDFSTVPVMNLYCSSLLPLQATSQYRNKTVRSFDDGNDDDDVDNDVDDDDNDDDVDDDC